MPKTTCRTLPTTKKIGDLPKILPVKKRKEYRKKGKRVTWTTNTIHEDNGVSINLPYKHGSAFKAMPTKSILKRVKTVYKSK